MPAKSKAQQRLFGMALAVRRGDLKRGEVDKDVLEIVDGDMTDKQIEEFASTPHKGLKDHIEESMTTIVLNPNQQETELVLANGCKIIEKDGKFYIIKET